MHKVVTRQAQSLTPDQLRTENQLLREQLEDLLSQAHRNQRIMLRHQTFDLQLIGASSFRELIENIFSTLAKTSDLDIVTLTLIDPKSSLRRILLDLNIDLMEFPHLLFVQTEFELGQLRQHLKKPVLGKYEDDLHGRMFAECRTKPSSVAVVPLIRQNKLIGCLNLGSYHASRFAPSMATDFIEHMASIIAICLENVINNERLTYIGLTDPLTGVSNRRHIEQRKLEEIGRARRQQYGIVCMYLDIDFFKQINDKHGHQGGDDVLRDVASRIKAELRLSDTLGRFGGEEFVVLLINTNQQHAVQVAERIRASIANKPFLLSMGGFCKATISIGIATLPATRNTGEIDTVAREMVVRADSALYEAKTKGRNQVRCAG
ncbi:MAG: sensor domain-containing diguanylate cyclase [Pseudomonadota bacterium]